MTYKYRKETLENKKIGQLRSIAVKLGMFDVSTLSKSMLIYKLGLKSKGEFLEVKG